MAVHQLDEPLPTTLEAVATQVPGSWVVDVVVGGGLLAVEVPSLEELDAAVNRALAHSSPATAGAVRVHIYAYQ
jgi:hypothetical protein